MDLEPNFALKGKSKQSNKYKVEQYLCHGVSLRTQQNEDFLFVLLMERRVSFQILRVKRIKRLPWFLIKSIVN